MHTIYKLLTWLILLRLIFVAVLVGLGGVGFLAGGSALKILHCFSFLLPKAAGLLWVGGGV